MARPSEYNIEFLKKYRGEYCIYALYTEKHGIKYIGKSVDVYRRFKHHLYNYDSETNDGKKNWVHKYKSDIRIKILHVANEEDWERIEKSFISEHRANLFNICDGGKSNRTTKPFHLQTTEEHLLEINKTLRSYNKYKESKGKEKRFKLLTRKEIENISNGIF